MINNRSFIARNCQIVAKIIMNIKNFAIRWQLLGRIILQFTKDWDKIREINLFQFAEIGIEIIETNLFQFTKDWDKIRETNLFQFHTDWDKIFLQ